MPSLRQLALRGSIWTLLGFSTNQFLRLCSNLLLTRWLPREFFGLMGLANTLVTGLDLFSDIGIAPSIVRSPRGDEPEFYNTAWTIQILRGVGIWVACCLLAWPAAQYFTTAPELVWLLPTLGLSGVLLSFSSTALHTLARRMVVGRIVLLKLCAQIASLAIMLVWARFNGTILALVLGSYVQALTLAFWSHRLLPHAVYENHLAWEPEALKELRSFGRWIFLSTALTFLASQSDRLILGKLIPIGLLGVYSIAFTFADLPRQVLQRLSSAVIFPLVSKRAAEPRALLRFELLAKRRWVVLGLAGLIAILSSSGDFLIQLLYDERYADGAWMLPVLALGLWPHVLSLTMSPALLAIGEPRYMAFGNALKFAYMLAALPLCFRWFGITGAIVAVAFNDLPYYGTVGWGLAREGLSSWWQDAWISCVLIGTIGLLFYIRAIAGWGLPLDRLVSNSI
ncbi:membrane protein involved in the export of O-antigen and teichoic acid [Rubidibacter lacunae KORDI 51-2]|uniref:Membrane protein involved in the export of O-antigen and teichoic acid n=1 Tax=Rubidibacter lacunae KORDI 51-2 TaxID=582515 RepID=U5DKD9_9CHRO|nr:oligosaccharide flippase family protein [Rubidibacter lacunae]ERN42131.1 membrane protein involved in the export of O-antigen and teichoic acid [Rubidibacter lacunae KORDI 51-2]